MLRHGFLSPSYYLYGFDEHRNYSAYVSEFEKMAYTAQINGPKREILDDKIAFHEAIRDRGFGDRLPTLFGAIRGGRDEVEDLSVRRILDLLDGGEALVLKGARGAAGAGIYICEAVGGDYVVNGSIVTAAEVRSIVESLEGYLVTEYCEQDEHVAAIYPGSPNTIRVLTMRSSDDLFIAVAVHRFGVDRSWGLDNWSRGGLSAKIDVETGELGPAAQFPFDGKVRWSDVHPETGTTITGRNIPGGIASRTIFSQLQTPFLTFRTSAGICWSPNRASL